MTDKDVLLEKDLLEKAAAWKRLEYSPLGKELKKQTSVVEKKYQDFDKIFNHDEREEPLKIEKKRPLTTAEPSLISNNKYSFSEFKNVEKYVKQWLKEFKKFTPRTVKTKKNKKIMYSIARKLYSKRSIYYNDYNDITDEEKRKDG